MGRKILFVAALLLGALALGLAACGGDDDDEAAAGEVTVQLDAQSGSGQTGTATLTEEAGKTKVVIELGNPPEEPQPAHIHPGSCDDLDPSPKYGLSNVEGGSSETTLSLSLDELRGGELAINIHRSEADPFTYVACGDIGEAPESRGRDEEEEGRY